MTDLVIAEYEEIANVADAIRSKTGTTEQMSLSQMATNVMSISSSDIIIDSELSEISTNPVQNKVVTKEIRQLSEEIVGEIGEKNLTSGSEIVINEDGLIYITNIDINDSEDDVITLTGKNLLNEDDFLNGIWEYPSWHTDVYNFDLPNGTYTFSFTQKAVEDTNGEWITLQISTDNFVTTLSSTNFLNSRNGWETDKATFTIEDGYKARIRHYSSAYSFKRDYFMKNVMLEKGSTATKYVSYVPPTECLYSEIAKNNLRMPVYDSYVNITNNNESTMNVSYTVNGDIYKYINKVVEKKEEEMKLYVTPQDFGAKGDGSTDDTLAIQEAINSGIKVIIPKTSRYYVFTSLEIPKGAKIEVLGKLETHIDNTAISIIGSDVEIYGSGEIYYHGTKSLFKIDVSGKSLANIRIETNLIGNEYEADTKTCVAIEITMGGSEYGYLFPSYIGGSIKKFNIGLWQHAEENSNENSWSTGLRFDGLINGCTEAIKFDTSGAGSEIWGQIQPYVVNKENANTLEKPLVTLNRYTTLGAMLWDFNTAVNKYLLYCREERNVILNSSWVIHFGQYHFVNQQQIVMPRAADWFKPRILGQYNTNVDYITSMNNILINAMDNPSITIRRNLTNCMINGEEYVYSCTNAVMDMVKENDGEVGICELEYEFDQLKTIRNVIVQGDNMPNKVRIEVYGNNSELADYHEAVNGIDFTEVPGGLTCVAWNYNHKAMGYNMLAPNVKKVKIRMELDAKRCAGIYTIVMFDGTDNFIPKTGGDVEGVLNCKSGLRLYDENGVAYDLIVDAEGKLSAILTN